MQIKIPQNPQTSFSLSSVDTPTQLRIEYNVNSPNTRKKSKDFKIVDLSDLEEEDAATPFPDFITQVTQDDPPPVVVEHSSCFCSAICFLSICKFKKERMELSQTENPTRAPATHSRVQVKKEVRTSIVRTSTLEMKTSVQPSAAQPSAVQLATIPPVSYGGCYIQQIEESTDDDEEASPWTEDGGEVVFVTDDDSLSSSEDPGLLGPKAKKFQGMKCLVLDLDETLVHSTFKPIEDADFEVPVEIEGIIYKVYVRKRPFVDEFLTEVAKHYEVVIFTASLGKYANPLLDMLDVGNVISHRLFRESCVYHKSSYVKDLSKLGRRMEDIIFIDNSYLSYAFQPYNAVPITSWFSDRSDLELKDILPVLTTTLKEIDDVRSLLDASKSYRWLCAQTKQI